MKTIPKISEFSMGMALWGVTFFVTSCTQDTTLPVPQITLSRVRLAGEDLSEYKIATDVVSEKGCALYKKTNYFLQIIDLSKGAKITLGANPVLTTANDVPIGGTFANSGNPSPRLSRKTVANYWFTDTKLFSITNGTFFDYSEKFRNETDASKCGRTTSSAFPVKNAGTILTCGNGGSQDDIGTDKRVFYINTNAKGFSSAGIANISLASYADFSFTNMTKKLQNYNTAIVGFHPEKNPKGIQYKLGWTQRTFIGVANGKVYILNGLSAGQGDMTSQLKKIMGVSTTDSMIMLDGSESTQLIVSKKSQIPYNRCVPSIILVYKGN